MSKRVWTDSQGKVIRQEPIEPAEELALIYKNLIGGIDQRTVIAEIAIGEGGSNDWEFKRTERFKEGPRMAALASWLGWTLNPGKYKVLVVKVEEGPIAIENVIAGIARVDQSNGDGGTQ